MDELRRICETVVHTCNTLNPQETMNFTWGLVQLMGFAWMVALWDYAGDAPKGGLKFLPTWTGILVIGYAALSYIILFRGAHLNDKSIRYGVLVGMTVLMLNQSFQWMGMGTPGSEGHGALHVLSWFEFIAIAALLSEIVVWRDIILQTHDYEQLHVSSDVEKQTVQGQGPSQPDEGVEMLPTANNTNQWWEKGETPGGGGRRSEGSTQAQNVYGTTQQQTDRYTIS